MGTNVFLQLFVSLPSKSSVYSDSSQRFSSKMMYNSLIDSTNPQRIALKDWLNDVGYECCAENLGKALALFPGGRAIRDAFNQLI